MNPTLLIALAIAATLIIYLVVLYNGLVALKHNASRDFSNIDVLLKQRNEELPKLVETCTQYMGYEQETLEKVIQARSAVTSAQNSGDMNALGQAETQMRAGLGQIFALAENYPELKADESFRHLQQRISGLDNSIADRREVYNEAVNNNNTRIEQFPDVILAKQFGFKAFELLEFADAEKADVDIKALFS